MTLYYFLSAMAYDFNVSDMILHSGFAYIFVYNPVNPKLYLCIWLIKNIIQRKISVNWFKGHSIWAKEIFITYFHIRSFNEFEIMNFYYLILY